jgi:hypothetical protein
MRAILTGLASALLLGATVSSAAADCACRAPGFIVQHGETVCLNTPSGPRLARCEKVLNNASWKFLAESCPEASRATERPVLAMSADTPSFPLR